MTFSLEPASAADPAPAAPGAVEPAAADPKAAPATDAATFAAATMGCAPMICCSVLNRLPNRLGLDPADVGAAVLLEESALESVTEPFLWPWP